MTEANAALLVANHNEGSEAEATATLHNLCDAVDVDETIHKFAIAFFAITIATATAFTFTSHFSLPSLARRT